MGEATEPGKKNAFVDALAFFLNVSSSVFIVFVNKQLMRAEGGNFKFATTLCALHFLVSGFYMWLNQLLGMVKRVKIPLNDLLWFIVVGNVSIVSLNLSLFYNSVGFYQVSKLLIIPFVCAVEFTWFGRRFSAQTVAAICCVAVGVGIVTVVGDASIRSTIGIFIAALSVVSSGMQQILVRHVQQKNKITSQELLLVVAPIQGAVLIAVGPFLDYYLTDSWVSDYSFTGSRFFWLCLSCCTAVLVNFSQFMVLGRFTAVTFQVLGHSKTMLVLFGGWLFLNELLNTMQWSAIGLAILGMVWYGYESGKKAPGPKGKALSPLRDGKGVPREATEALLGGKGVAQS